MIFVYPETPQFFISVLFICYHFGDPDVKTIVISVDDELSAPLFETDADEIFHHEETILPLPGRVSQQNPQH